MPCVGNYLTSPFFNLLILHFNLLISSFYEQDVWLIYFDETICSFACHLLLWYNLGMEILELIGRLIAILGLIFLSVRVIFWKQSVKDKDRYFATLGLYCVYMIFIIAWNS